MTPKTDDNTKEKRGKWRLSNLLHPKDNERPMEPNPENNNTQDTLNTDSAYESNSGENSSTGIPTISDSQANAQGADIKTKTDEATGKTITTTTTTTTTTVTTTGGDHYQIPAGEEVVVKQADANDNPAELSARPVSQDSGSALANNQTTTNRPQASQQGPAIPPKDNRRRSQSPHRVSAIDTHSHAPFLSPLDQPSPTHRHNFSYPSRTPPAVLPQQQPQYPNTGQPLRPPNSAASQPPYKAYHLHDRPYEEPGYGYGPYSPAVGSQSDQLRPSQVPERGPSTVQSLKTAAAGIHGASEALRGTLNSSIARRTGAPPEVVAAHNEVANRGRQEVETGRFYNPPTPSNPAGTDPRHPSVPVPTAPAGQRPSSFEYNRLQPTTSAEQRYSANQSANGVLSQVGVQQSAGPYYGGANAVGQDVNAGQQPIGGKKKGGLRNVLRKSKDGIRT